jgi:hypothetical protein
MRLIERETRGGFHASFGRGSPCTLLSRCGASSLLEQGKGGKAAGDLPRPLQGWKRTKPCRLLRRPVRLTAPCALRSSDCYYAL